MTAPISHPELRHRTVGDIAATVPGATAILRRFRINFCCGGDITLAEAAAQRGVDPTELESALDDRGDQGPGSSPAELSDGDLTRHIEAHYHGAYRQMLPELIALSTKVESVHRGKPGVPAGLADALQQMEHHLDAHMRAGEEGLFPSIRDGRGSPADGVVARLRKDHDEQAALLDQMEQLTDGFRPPAGACRSWQALYVGGARLSDDLMEHIYLENNVLFPRVAATADQ